jgi:FkbM family methyltransferase
VNIYGVELIDDKDMVVTSYSRRGFFEPTSMREWEKVKGPTVDVGSYTGLYAIKSSQLGNLSFALEPNPAVYERLKENVRKNNVSVVMVNKAAGSEKGTLPLYLKSDTLLTSAGSLLERKDKSVDVEVMVVDDIEYKLAGIKIDAEGYEIDVLKGAYRQLTENHPLVIAEALDTKSEQELISFMSALGYSHQFADERNIIFKWKAS